MSIISINIILSKVIFDDLEIVFILLDEYLCCNYVHYFGWRFNLVNSVISGNAVTKMFMGMPVVEVW